MTRVAPTFFGDLNHILAEYIVLQVCKLTDPAQDFKKNDNHTVAFLMQHYGLTGHVRLSELNARMQAFRQKVVPARNKLIGHADRDAIMAGAALGGAPKAEWDQFWDDLDELVNVIHQHVVGEPFSINNVGGLSDADGLLKSLLSVEALEALMGDKDPVVRKRAADVALG